MNAEECVYLFSISPTEVLGYVTSPSSRAMRSGAFFSTQSNEMLLRYNLGIGLAVVSLSISASCTGPSLGVVCFLLQIQSSCLDTELAKCQAIVVTVMA